MPADPTTASATWLSPAAHQQLSSELDELVANRTAIATEINARREEGDLKENGGYHAAKEEQGKQEARIRYLTQFLRSAQVGEAPAGDKVGPGMVITVRFDADDEPEEFLLGSREVAGTTDLTVYSPESALGQAILGHRKGDTVSYEAPSGAEIKVQIADLRPF